MNYTEIKTSKKMNEVVKEQLIFRDDHLSKYAAKRIEELEQLNLSGVSNSLVADIRNKLSSPKNLCAMLKDREVEPFIGDDQRNQMIDAEIEQTLKSIDYLSNL